MEISYQMPFITQPNPSKEGATSGHNWVNMIPTIGNTQWIPMPQMVASYQNPPSAFGSTALSVMKMKEEMQQLRQLQHHKHHFLASSSNGSVLGSISMAISSIIKALSLISSITSSSSKNA